MEIRVLDENLYQRYEEFIQTFEGGLFFYSVKYKLFLEQLLTCKSIYFLVMDGNEILAVLPMMKKVGKYGNVYNSLPYYGSNGGILSKLEYATKLLIKKFDELADKNDTAVTMLVTNPLENAHNPPNHDLVDERIGQFTLIDYENNIAEYLMNSFHSKTRNMVRKAQKSDIEVYIDNSDFDFLEKIHIENMNTIGGKNKSSKFFNLIAKNFEENKDYNIFVAKKDNIKIAAILIFYYNNVVEYFTPVVKAEYRTYQPISLLIYEAMNKAAKNGFKLWNWGGTWLSQDGVYKFKHRFGAIDKEYKYYIKIKNQEIYNSSKVELLDEYDGFYTIPFDKLGAT